MLQEKLHIFGILGCVLCVVGSTTIVLHAPQEREIESVKEVWDLATEPGIYFWGIKKICEMAYKFLMLYFVSSFVSYCCNSCVVMSPAAFLLYAAIVIAAVIVIIIRVIPYYGQTHVMVYISVCSLMGSLSVCAGCYPSLESDFSLTLLCLSIHLFIHPCAHMYRCNSTVVKIIFPAC